MSASARILAALMRAARTRWPNRTRKAKPRGARLALMRVFGTREFDEQTSRHSFGSIALAVEF